MLNFWYSERCTREIKLIVSMSTCLLIYLCSSVKQLSTSLTIASVGLGILLHVLRLTYLKIQADNPYKTGFGLIFVIVPLVLFISIIGLIPPQHKLMLSLQAIGFVALGLFIISIYSERAKRYDN